MTQHVKWAILEASGLASAACPKRASLARDGGSPCTPKASQICSAPSHRK